MTGVRCYAENYRGAARQTVAASKPGVPSVPNILTGQTAAASYFSVPPGSVASKLAAKALVPEGRIAT